MVSSSNSQFHLLSTYTVGAKLPFFFFPHTCTNLNKGSLHEQRDLWLSFSKKKKKVCQRKHTMGMWTGMGDPVSCRALQFTAPNRWGYVWKVLSCTYAKGQIFSPILYFFSRGEERSASDPAWYLPAFVTYSHRQSRLIKWDVSCWKIILPNNLPSFSSLTNGIVCFSPEFMQKPTQGITRVVLYVNVDACSRRSKSQQSNGGWGPTPQGLGKIMKSDYKNKYKGLNSQNSVRFYCILI